jgi:hypothetical protein
MESEMIRPILAAGSVAVALMVSPAMAQQQPPAPTKPQEAPAPTRPEAQQLDAGMVGLAVYSSDGQKLGQVAEVGMSAGSPAIRAEMGEFLGLGATSVVIHADAFERKGDRIEVAMTAAEIKDTLAKQRSKQPK